MNLHTQRHTLHLLTVFMIIVLISSCTTDYAEYSIGKGHVAVKLPNNWHITRKSSDNPLLIEAQSDNASATISVSVGDKQSAFLYSPIGPISGSTLDELGQSMYAMTNAYFEVSPISFPTYTVSPIRTVSLCGQQARQLNFSSQTRDDGKWDATLNLIQIGLSADHLPVYSIVYSTKTVDGETMLCAVRYTGS